jgi:hypothetical protein
MAEPMSLIRLAALAAFVVGRSKNGLPAVGTLGALGGRERAAPPA